MPGEEAPVVFFRSFLGGQQTHRRSVAGAALERRRLAAEKQMGTKFKLVLGEDPPAPNAKQSGVAPSD